MNLWPSKKGPYDPLTYDVRRTVSVRIMLHGPWLEMRFPKHNLPLRRMHDDVEPTVEFHEHVEVIDLSTCSIDIQPENLPTKRIWSKKYPIRIRTETRKPFSTQVSFFKSRTKWFFLFKKKFPFWIFLENSLDIFSNKSKKANKNIFKSLQSFITSQKSLKRKKYSKTLLHNLYINLSFWFTIFGAGWVYPPKPAGRGRGRSILPKCLQ
jgi:hypothetical protein